MDLIRIAARVAASDPLAAAIEAALATAVATAPEDRVGGQFAAKDNDLWASGSAEVTLEFPDDPEVAHVTVVRGGDGEPTGYSNPLSGFSAADAAASVRKFFSAHEAPGATPAAEVPAGLEALLTQAEAAGWKIADVVMDISESIYWGLVLCKNTAPWEPYKAPRRSLEPCDAYVIGYWHDDEATLQNMNGEFTYEAWTDEETGEEHPADNWKISQCGPDEAAETLEGSHAAEAMERIRGVLDGTADRWDGAIRLDQ